MGRPNVPCFKIDVPTIKVAPTLTTTPAPNVVEVGTIYIPDQQLDCDAPVSSSSASISISQHPADASCVLNDYAKFSVLATCNIPAVLEYNWHIGTSQNFSVSSSTLLNSGNGDGTIMFGPVSNSNNNKFIRVSITAHTQYGTVNILSNSAKFTVKI